VTGLSLRRLPHWRRLFSEAPVEEKLALVADCGVLEPVFARFLAREAALAPLPEGQLLALFDRCSDPESALVLEGVLRELAPGGRRVGFRQVNRLVDHLRGRIAAYLASRDVQLDLVAHDHAFGSGGDFCKTGHATTWASLLVAPRLRICKSGTTNVTSEHGSSHAVTELGYREPGLDGERLNQQLVRSGFAFLSLGTLGFPYSPALRTARRALWFEASEELERAARRQGSWTDAVRDTPIPLDLFKVVSPNAQILGPVHHSTGICHLDMLPYVLGIYDHLGSRGIISHAFDGIDELSNAVHDPADPRPNNLLVEVDGDELVILEFGPEALDMPRVSLTAIREEPDLAIEVAGFRQVLAGCGQGARTDFIRLNAAVLLAANRSEAGVGLPRRLGEGLASARDLILSGAARDNLEGLLAY
jgi:anthranilate phosphoribosyltransferase